jgi:CRISPR/Cas system endoribonuclease Cas6 (RAMP superfamily)
MQLIRRVASLQDFYTSTPLEADFKRLKALTEKAKIEKAVYKQQDSRYSARHQQKIDTSGFMGKITLNMIGIEALWPYIYLGQWLNVGKNSSFGYGRYELLRLK